MVLTMELQMAAKKEQSKGRSSVAKKGNLLEYLLELLSVVLKERHLVERKEPRKDIQLAV
jgi:hypothetical protein